MEKSAIITAKGLCIGYRSHGEEKHVHDGLSFELLSGELTSLIGVNGAGKSTLLRTLSASQPTLGGELLINGKPIRLYSERELSRTIGVVLTDKTQAGGLTVRELVALGRQPHTGFFGRLHKHDNDIIDEMMTAVGIAYKANTYIAELSDGERQKVMIAKALVQECPLIILDEPTAFLDVVNRIEIMNLLHQIAVTQHKAILLSTHDIEQALVLSDRLWLLSKEHGLQHGVTEDIILSHKMDSIFTHKNIRFDYDHGVYYPAVSGTKEISVESNDETLLHWAINALNRNGYICYPGAQGRDDIPHLTVSAATQLTLTKAANTTEYTSFAALLSNLD